MSLEDLLIWIVFLHNTNKREAVATAISEIRSDFGGCSKEQVKAVGETLGRLFTSNELNWDVSRPGVGGLASYRRLLRHYDQVQEFCSHLAAVGPSAWTIETIADKCPKKIPDIGISAPYLRGHLLRQVALLAKVCGAQQTPKLTPAGWKTLLDLLPSTGTSAANQGGIHNYGMLN